jgi:hypothetical protein
MGVTGGGDDLRQGGCLCGKVRFTARHVPRAVGVCHCAMCRRWTGSALIEVSLPAADVTWADEGAIARYRSSPWAERGFCATCGTGLFFRMLEDNEFSGGYDMPIGIFDDANGFVIQTEIYIDHKPDSFAYQAAAGLRHVTRAECVAKFPRLDDDLGARP